jgi:hypothetical protein
MPRLPALRGPKIIETKHLGAFFHWLSTSPPLLFLFTFYFRSVFMTPLQLSFEEAIAQSYQLYQEKGPRSPEKLRPLHGWFAETLRNRLDPQRFSIQDLNTEGGEAQIEGRYFPKRVDIAILSKKDEAPLVAVSVRFVGSNFKQNANNYFENLLGECANLRRRKIGFAHFLILPVRLPYKRRTGEIKREEEVNQNDLSKYFALFDDDEHPHRPEVLGLALVDLTQKSSDRWEARICTPHDFSEQNKKYLNELSIENFIRRVVGLCELKA